jgi:hypothetical protein
MAATKTLRIYVAVPEIDAPSMQAGATPTVTLDEYPGQVFHGSLVGTALRPIPRRVHCSEGLRVGVGSGSNTRDKAGPSERALDYAARDIGMRGHNLAAVFPVRPTIRLSGWFSHPSAERGTGAVASDLPTERGLGDMDRRRGTREAAALHYPNEITQMAQLHG